MLDNIGPKEKYFFCWNLYEGEESLFRAAKTVLYFYVGGANAALRPSVPILNKIENRVCL